MLALLSMAFFVVPINNTEAQSGSVRTLNLCYHSTNLDIQYAYTNGTIVQCPTGSGWNSFSTQSSNQGVCAIQNTTSTPAVYTLDIPKFDTNGKPYVTNGNCVIPGTTTAIGKFYSFASITKTYTPPNTNTNVNNANNSNNGNNTNNGGGNTGGGTNVNGTTTPQTPCPGANGFHKVGPLCVPDSGFSNSALVSTNTATGLAVRIIRILLYFGAIVAVVMAIIGGYQVMTAGSNATQATNGRKTLTNAIIGLVIVILSYAIITAVVNFVTK